MKNRFWKKELSAAAPFTPVRFSAQMNFIPIMISLHIFIRYFFACLLLKWHLDGCKTASKSSRKKGREQITPKRTSAKQFHLMRNRVAHRSRQMLKVCVSVFSVGGSLIIYFLHAATDLLIMIFRE